MQALTNARVMTGDGIVHGQAVLLDQGRIEALVPESAVPQGAEMEDLGGALLVPGFIDTQVNGGGGVLFNDAPTVETVARIAEAHRPFGTTGLLPTLISDDLDVVTRGIEAVDAAIAAGVPGILGIHIEGPFLNAERKGIHDQTKIRKIDEAGFAALTSLRRGKTLVTLAPECTTPELVARLVGAGVIVAAGHSNGSYDDIRAALDSGLSGFTHLFNGMSQLSPREPGVVGAALDDAHSWCGLIVDGLHVSPVTLRLALRCKPADKFMLVTDAMPNVGAADKSFLLQGRRIQVIDGICRNDDGTIAGSDLDMAQAVRNAVEMLSIDLLTAVRMASRNPATFLGLEAETGSIAPGLRADLALLDDGGRVVKTWIAGKTLARLG
jgi:N-acetylglucosamine-6-phosphate deacetylase